MPSFLSSDLCCIVSYTILDGIRQITYWCIPQDTMPSEECDSRTIGWRLGEIVAPASQDEAALY